MRWFGLDYAGTGKEIIEYGSKIAFECPHVEHRSYDFSYPKKMFTKIDLSRFKKFAQNSAATSLSGRPSESSYSMYGF